MAESQLGTQGGSGLVALVSSPELWVPAAGPSSQLWGEAEALSFLGLCHHMEQFWFLLSSQKLAQASAGVSCLCVCVSGGVLLFIDLLITPERIQEGRGLQRHPPS